ncbi:DUF2971 domain-containing protein [Sphingobacterium rhinopitheci]|uniref:DUF2971 domain-containing protein n=1 Tax=Sphingobacterium rhinopitheci TaxID=2781960 RepID=UPI001F5213A4|nr:DUF2971 domain-containing protein [Sphingobacterium rhinopitheci]MCI0920550.1 DUF2971 domain-containing protein [Sphingobacterium rhinopitheci]
MFKYYKIPSGDILEKILGEKATIKFSSAFNLNDTFELKFNLDIEPEYDGHEKAFYDRNPDSTKEDFERWKSHALNHHGYTWYAEQAIRDSLAQNISLCSFSKNNTSNLMWSHYTDNYKGICIEYNEELFDYLHSLKNHIASDIITYSETPPILKGSDPVDIIAKKLMFNKQIEWQYEEEYRIIIRSDENTEFIPIDRSLIKSCFYRF